MNLTHAARRIHAARFFALLGLALLLGALPRPDYARQLTDADYARAAKFLLRSTDPLVGRNYDPLVDHEVQRVHWLDATHFWYRDHDASGDRFFEMDARTDQRLPAFDESKLAAALGKPAGKPLDAKHWPHAFDFRRLPDGRLAVAIAGKHYRCDLSGAGRCTQEKTGLKGVDGHAERSSDGKWLVFARDWNLWLRDEATGKVTQLTSDGVANDGYATESFGPMTSNGAVVRWAPDSRSLVAFRLDLRKVKDMYALVTRVGHPKLESWPYPLPGDKHVFMVRPVVIDVATRKVTPLQMAPEQQLGSWNDVQWAPDSKTFALVSTSRDRRQEWFRIADAATGDVRTVFEYTAKDFYQGWYGRPDWQYLPASGEAIWPTEQNNWMNLYLYSLKTGKMLHPITTGHGDVIQVLHLDRKTRTLWYVGVGRTPGMNPYYRQLFKVNIDTGKTTLLTPEDADHRITMAPDGRYFVDSYSTPTTPPVTVLRAADDGRILATVARTDIARLVATGWVPPVPFTVKARNGTTTLYGLLYKPTNFDPHKKYPIVDFVYPGPQIGSIATFSFRSERGSNQALAELGFIVVTLDGMGTPYRSASFQRAWYGDMGDDTIPDQIAGIKQLAARYPWMDLDRVGIWGHSGGGNATVSAMLHDPDFFKVGWAESGNYDNRDYYYAWGEKWEGLLVKHKNGTSNYDNQASELLAKNLKGHLMLVQGSIDDNVPISNTYLLVSALMKANKNFDMLIVPNERHHYGPYTPYITRRMWDFFVRYLAGNTPPHEFDGMPKSLTQ
ncbi:S9 family peptidase [Metallibacterium scheffleri]|uniref:S9 family peptidase n=4 Tax=root TaxID=1 RepID=A0A4S3KNN2_9GAMM|nr:S9 family peptidase [Metallibacterium scheffleri]THD10456.1 S9 family peptidase [Metallibacterium scheffleri]